MSLPAEDKENPILSVHWSAHLKFPHWFQSSFRGWGGGWGRGERSRNVNEIGRKQGKENCGGWEPESCVKQYLWDDIKWSCVVLYNSKGIVLRDLKTERVGIDSKINEKLEVQIPPPPPHTHTHTPPPLLRRYSHIQGFKCPCISFIFTFSLDSPIKFVNALWSL